jgi:hypothetical protein
VASRNAAFDKLRRGKIGRPEYGLRRAPRDLVGAWACRTAGEPKSEVGVTCEMGFGIRRSGF